eukprot:scaffold222073_cov48-Cyclotella_meneghiniana.AAC.1
MPCSWDWNALPARGSTKQVLSSERVKSHHHSPSWDWNALPARVSTGWILSSERLGLECFASKGLHQTGFELRDGEKS